MKTLLGLLTILCASVTTWAQGTVSFNNNVFATQANPRLVMLGGLPLTGTDYVAQLYYGTQGTPDASLTPVGAVARFRVATTSQPGTWSGGTRNLPGIVPGQTATLQVRAWNATLFPAGYDAAVTGGGIRGASALFDYTVPSGSTPAPNEFWMWNLKDSRWCPSRPRSRWVSWGRWACSRSVAAGELQLRSRPSDAFGRFHFQSACVAQ